MTAPHQLQLQPRRLFRTEGLNPDRLGLRTPGSQEDGVVGSCPDTKGLNESLHSEERDPQVLEHYSNTPSQRTVGFLSKETSSPKEKTYSSP